MLTHGEACVLSSSRASSPAKPEPVLDPSSHKLLCQPARSQPTSPACLSASSLQHQKLCEFPTHTHGLLCDADVLISDRCRLCVAVIIHRSSQNHGVSKAARAALNLLTKRCRQFQALDLCSEPLLSDQKIEKKQEGGTGKTRGREEWRRKEKKRRNGKRINGLGL